jgi:alanine-glyoxylate transaminase / serine-glyoxylate transaminase / serine-pyruvate transaminase
MEASCIPWFCSRFSTTLHEMTPTLPSLDPPKRLLAGPGPSNVDPHVLAAMQKPMLSHLDPDLHDILLEVVDFQRQVYNAKGGLVFPHQATGSSGMECGLQNLLEPGDTAIVSVTGFFGNRIAKMAERTGAKVIEVKADFGQITPNDELLDAIEQNPDARLVAVVHAETSTGVRHPVAELGAELKRRNSDTLLFVDCVTSLGAHEVQFDEWGIDYAYSCTQKALAAPPGMSPVAISDRALERVAARKQPVPFTFDLDLLKKFWVDRPVTYHHTAPILHIYALH